MNRRMVWGGMLERTGAHVGGWLICGTALIACTESAPPLEPRKVPETGEIGRALCEGSTTQMVDLWSPEGMERADTFSAMPATPGLRVGFVAGGDLFRFDPDPTVGTVERVGFTGGPQYFGAPVVRAGKDENGPLVTGVYPTDMGDYDAASFRVEPAEPVGPPRSFDPTSFLVSDAVHGPNGPVLAGRSLRSGPMTVSVGSGLEDWAFDPSVSRLRLEPAAGAVLVTRSATEPPLVQPFDYAVGRPEGEAWAVSPCPEQFSSTAPLSVSVLATPGSSASDIYLAIVCLDEVKLERRALDGERLEDAIFLSEAGAADLNWDAAGHLILAIATARGDTTLHLLDPDGFTAVRGPVSVPIEGRARGQTRLSVWTDAAVPGRIAVGAMHVIGHGAGDQEVVRIDACPGM